MNGLDDYKNILSGGIRVVDWNYEPTTSVEGSPAATLEIGDAIVVSGSGSEWMYVYFTGTYTIMEIIGCGDDVNATSATSMMTDNDILVLYDVTSTILRRKFTNRGSSQYVFTGTYTWILLRIA